MIIYSDPVYYGGEKTASIYTGLNHNQHIVVDQTRRYQLWPARLMLSWHWYIGSHGVQSYYEGPGQQTIKLVLSVGFLRIIFGRDKKPNKEAKK